MCFLGKLKTSFIMNPSQQNFIAATNANIEVQGFVGIKKEPDLASEEILTPRINDFPAQYVENYNVMTDTLQVDCDEYKITLDEVNLLLNYPQSKIKEVDSEGCASINSRYQNIERGREEQNEEIKYINVNDVSAPHEFVNVRDSSVRHETFHDTNIPVSHPSTSSNSSQTYPNKLQEHYSCPKCFVPFLHKSSVTRHLKAHENKTLICENTQRYGCILCEKKFATKRSLHSHRAQHYKREYQEKERGEEQQQDPSGKRLIMHKCQTCSKVFQTARILLAHNRTHIVKEKYTCHICNRDMTNKSTFYAHTNIHKENNLKQNVEQIGMDMISKNMAEENDLIGRGGDNDIEYKEPVGEGVREIKTESICFEESNLNEFYGEGNNRTVEIKIEQKVEIKSDPEVDYNNDNYNNLCTPYLTSTQTNASKEIPEKNHLKCSLCPKSFFSEESLQRHVNLHGDDKNVQCEFCFKSFARRVSLLEHMLQHKWSTEKSNLRRDWWGRKIEVKDEAVEGEL